MGVSWCKVASNLDSHPKIRKAGRHGREIFLFALRRNAEPHNKVIGSISADELGPEYLADILQMPVTDAVTGVTAAVTAGLLVQEGTRFRIVGWEEGWGKDNGTGAERTARYRENKKLRESVTPVTSRDVTPVTSDTCDIEEKRLEERRTLSVPAAPAESGDLFGSLKAKVDAATVDVGKQRAKKPPAESKAPAPHQPAIEHFDTRYSEAYGCRPEWRASGEAKQIADLTKRHGAAEVIRRIDALFDGSAELAWLKPPFTVGTLNNNWNRLVAVSDAPRVSDRRINDL